MIDRLEEEINLLSSSEQHRLSDILSQYREATYKHKRGFISPHEGYGVLIEEVEELFDEIKANNHNDMLTEAAQVGAMSLRFLVDLGK